MMGRIWAFGDNVDTDQIVPGRYAPYMTGESPVRYAFVERRPEFAASVRPGDVLAAGDNFGCGSSREYAMEALVGCGLAAIWGCSCTKRRSRVICATVQRSRYTPRKAGSSWMDTPTCCRPCPPSSARSSPPAGWCPTYVCTGGSPLSLNLRLRSQACSPRLKDEPYDLCHSRRRHRAGGYPGRGGGLAGGRARSARGMGRRRLRDARADRRGAAGAHATPGGRDGGDALRRGVFAAAAHARL